MRQNKSNEYEVLLGKVPKHPKQLGVICFVISFSQNVGAGHVNLGPLLMVKVSALVELFSFFG